MSLNQEHDLHRRRRSRNLAVGGVLLAFAVLVFAITIAKMTDGQMMEAFDHTLRPSLVTEETK
jgi:hypothetical protein